MRGRRRGSGGTHYWFTLVAVFLLLASSVTIPSGPFTTGTMDRDATVGVVEDESAIIELEKYSPLDVGSFNDLLTVTNTVDSGLEATVSIDPAYGDRVDLVADSERGDSVTITLGSGTNETVSSDLDADCSLDGKRLPYTVDGDTAAFDGTIERTILMQAPNAVREHVVFKNKTDGSFQMTSNTSGAVTKFGFNPSGFGAPSKDYDCDGRTEAPYVDSNGNIIVIIDSTGERQQLLAGDARLNARLGVADIDGDGKPAVLYSNVSDSSYLYRVEHGSSPTKVGDIRVHSLTQPAYITNDSDKEIVFTDPLDGELKYTDLQGNIGSLNGAPGDETYIGDPADFDCDGEVRVPYVDGKNQLMIVGTKTDAERLKSGSDGAIGSIATLDWDSDGKLEVVYVDDGDSQFVKYVELYGATEVMSDENGTDVTAHSNGTS